MHKSGYLKVHIGPMFAGKSTHIITTYKRFSYKTDNVIIVNHASDTRYTNIMKLDETIMDETESHKTTNVVSHNKLALNAISVHNLQELYDMTIYKTAEIILIDEGNLYDDITDFINTSVNIDKKHVEVYGLTGTFEMKPFGKLLDILPMTTDIEQLKALCELCPDNVPAEFTKNKVKLDNELTIGGADMYMSVCRYHYLNS